MKINWGALGVTIAVLFLAVSILAVELVVDERISRLGQQIKVDPIVKALICHT